MGIAFWKSLLFFLGVGIFSVYLFPTQRQLGLLLSKARDFDQARFYLEKQFHRDPGDVRNTQRYLKALMYDEQDVLFERAARMLEKSYGDQLWFNEIQADFYESKMQFEKASGYWLKMIRLDPRLETVREKLISHYFYSRDSDGLLNLYEFEKGHAAFNPRLYEELVRLCLLKKLPEKAALICREWLEHSPRDAKIQLRLAEIREYEGKTDEALAIYRQVADEYPQNRAYAAQVVDRLFFYKRGAELLRVLEIYSKRFPNEEEFFKLLSDLYVRSGKKEDAIRLLRALYERNPSKYKLMELIAEIYFGEGDFSEARSYLEQYHEKTGGTYHSHHVLGDVMAALGDSKGSEKEYRRALELLRVKR
ncbi:MAG TPA: tetratricopeptide repeat protein [Candidatus Omnitrophota bacterium]|nr:tetratricopeptide repeat protein [Candidatus Omnitrophota bacterium]